MEDKRNKGIYIKLTQREIDLIEEKMKHASIRNRSGFIRKMAIDGLIIQLDMPELSEISRLLKITSNNANQIAKRANETGSIYGEDVAEVMSKLEDIRLKFGDLLQSLSKLQGQL